MHTFSRPAFPLANGRPASARLPRTWTALFVLLCVGTLTLGAFSPAAARAATVTQSFALQPGWNSIFVDVTPAAADPAVLFAGLPVDQVWTYFSTRSPVEFLSDPAGGLFNVPGWNVYLPAGSRPDAAMLTDLKGIIGHQAYLIKNTSTSVATLNVTGTLATQDIDWNPDSFTLTGLLTDPSTTVRSGDFFANSPAHTGQPRYQLLPSGTWSVLANTAPLVPGQAYWIYTKGGSDYFSPLEVNFGGGRVLDYGPGGQTKTINIRNRSAYATNVTLTNSPGGLPLSIQKADATNNNPNAWTIFSGSQTYSVPANGSITLTLGLRRAALSADAEGILNVAGGGVAVRVPLAAQLLLPTKSDGTILPLNPNTGLWVGTATLNAVSEANSPAPGTLTPTAAPFSLRLLIHVDGGGQARLLKEVTLMKKRAAVAGTASPLVLVTDPALLGNFDAPQTRDGSPFASRISCVGFDFAATSVSLGGSFGSSLVGTFTMDRNLVTNPFKHRYHPDHNDLDANYQAPADNLPPDQQEVWGLTRAVRLAFDAATAGANPDTGYTERTGTYNETFNGIGNTIVLAQPGASPNPTGTPTPLSVPNPGLHRNTVYVSGPFTLRRLNTISEINPAVN